MEPNHDNETATHTNNRNDDETIGSNQGDNISISNIVAEEQYEQIQENNNEAIDCPDYYENDDLNKENTNSYPKFDPSLKFLNTIYFSCKNC